MCFESLSTFGSLCSIFRVLQRLSVFGAHSLASNVWSYMDNTMRYYCTGPVIHRSYTIPWFTDASQSRSSYPPQKVQQRSRGLENKHLSSGSRTTQDWDWVILESIWEKMEDRVSFGLDKCGWMVCRRVKKITAEGFELPEGSTADFQDSYKYLWIPQVVGNHQKAVRRSATDKCLKRVAQVLKNRLKNIPDPSDQYLCPASNQVQSCQVVH